MIIIIIGSVILKLLLLDKDSRIIDPIEIAKCLAGSIIKQNDTIDNNLRTLKIVLFRFTIFMIVSSNCFKCPVLRFF